MYQMNENDNTMAYLHDKMKYVQLFFALLTQVIAQEMKDFLQTLKQKVVVAVVGGSDLVKIKEQMGGESCEFELIEIKTKKYN